MGCVYNLDTQQSAINYFNVQFGDVYYLLIDELLDFLISGDFYYLLIHGYLDFLFSDDFHYFLINGLLDFCFLIDV